MLRQIPEEQIEAFCRYELTPYKTGSLDSAYANRATFGSDMALILRTARVCVKRGKSRQRQPRSLGIYGRHSLLD